MYVQWAFFTGRLTVRLTKGYKILKGVMQARLLGRRVPLVASIIPTNRCNLKCLYCARWEKPGEELPVETWQSLLRELESLGCIRLSITGGEPLLYKGIESIIETAKGLGMRVGLNTNGLLVPKKRDVLKQVDAVVLSLDGTKSINDEIRGRGAFDGVMEAAKVAKEMGKAITLYTVISKRNAGELESVVEIAREFGGTALFQPGTQMDFDLIKDNPETPGADEYRKAVDRLIRMKKEKAPIGNSMAGLSYLRNWPDPSPLKCFGGQLFIRIEPDGNLRHCGRDRQEDKLSILQGAAKAMSQMPEPPCSACWSSSRVEFNLMMNFNFKAVLGYLVSGI